MATSSGKQMTSKSLGARSNRTFTSNKQKYRNVPQLLASDLGDKSCNCSQTVMHSNQLPDAILQSGLSLKSLRDGGEQVRTQRASRPTSEN
eukprot:13583-Hanusia_phi.AAC.4